MGRLCGYLLQLVTDISITHQSLAFWDLHSSLVVGGISAEKKTLSQNKPKLLTYSAQNLLSLSLLSPSPSNIPVGRGSVIGAACLTAIIFSTQIH